MTETFHRDRLSPRPALTDKPGQIRALLESLSRTTGLSACLHDLYGLTGLEKRWLEHWNDACMDIKRDHQPQCARFCGGSVHREVGSATAGRVHTCPFGFTDITVPVLAEGRPICILFLGTCWTGRGAPPHPHLPVARDSRWVEDRLQLARAAACRISELLRLGEGPPDTRRAAILTHVHRNIGSPVRLAGLAQALGLSQSRSGHVVRELFGMTLPMLIAEVKLNEAARLLGLTDQSVAEIALGLGYCDQSHFSRAFRRRHRMSPLTYRRRHRTVV